MKKRRGKSLFDFIGANIRTILFIKILFALQANIVFERFEYPAPLYWQAGIKRQRDSSTTTALCYYPLQRLLRFVMAAVWVNTGKWWAMVFFSLAAQHFIGYLGQSELQDLPTSGDCMVLWIIIFCICILNFSLRNMMPTHWSIPQYRSLKRGIKQHFSWVCHFHDMIH